MSGQAGDFGDLRLRQVRDGLHDIGLNGLLVTRPAGVRYLSGFSGSSALLLVQPGVATLVTDFRYATQAAAEVNPGIGVVVADDELFTSLARILEGVGPGRRFGFDESILSVGDRRALGEACPDVSWEPAARLVAELRARKSHDEVSRVEEAVRVAEAALEAVLPVVEEGMTERQLAAELEFRLRMAGSEAIPFETIVASGPRTALPHARPGDRRLAEGDLLLIDFGAVVHGYCSDITRTFTLGPATPWQAAIHEAVREALNAALGLVASGRKARDVDQGARFVLEEKGLAERFGHGTGHGVGLEVHEPPRLNRRSRDVLQTGNVVTIEPGVYLPERGGVRLEEVVVVEPAAGRVLTRFSLDLAEL